MPQALQFRSLLGTQEDESSQDAVRKAAPTERGQRRTQLRGHLDELVLALEHARRDADQMIGDMSALEVEASQLKGLQRGNAKLRADLDRTASELSTVSAKAENGARDVVRLKEELARIRKDYEASALEASANAVDASRSADRLRASLTALEDAKRDLQLQREARERAKLEVDCLRANLTERDTAHNALLRSDAELRQENAALKSRCEEAMQALRSKEQLCDEISKELADARDRLAALESSEEAAQEKLRVMRAETCDAKASRDARITALNEELDHERENHRMTRERLEEARGLGEETPLDKRVADIQRRLDHGSADGCFENQDVAVPSSFMVASPASPTPKIKDKVDAAPAPTRNVARIRRR